MSFAQNLLVFSPNFVLDKDKICPNQIIYNFNVYNEMKIAATTNSSAATSDFLQKQDLQIAGLLQGLNGLVSQAVGDDEFESNKVEASNSNFLTEVNISENESIDLYYYNQADLYFCLKSGGRRRDKTPSGGGGNKLSNIKYPKFTAKKYFKLFLILFSQQLDSLIEITDQNVNRTKKKMLSEAPGISRSDLTPSIPELTIADCRKNLISAVFKFVIYLDQNEENIFNLEHEKSIPGCGIFSQKIPQFPLSADREGSHQKNTNTCSQNDLSEIPGKSLKQDCQLIDINLILSKFTFAVFKSGRLFLSNLPTNCLKKIMEMNNSLPNLERDLVVHSFYNFYKFKVYDVSSLEQQSSSTSSSSSKNSKIIKHLDIISVYIFNKVTAAEPQSTFPQKSIFNPLKKLFLDDNETSSPSPNSLSMSINPSSHAFILSEESLYKKYIHFSGSDYFDAPIRNQYDEVCQIDVENFSRVGLPKVEAEKCLNDCLKGSLANKRSKNNNNNNKHDKADKNNIKSCPVSKIYTKTLTRQILPMGSSCKNQGHTTDQQPLKKYHYCLAERQKNHIYSLGYNSDSLSVAEAESKLEKKVGEILLGD